jgi:nitroreductase
MDVIQAIQERRAYRSLAPVKITTELVSELAKSTQLAPSCANYQPWRFVYVSQAFSGTCTPHCPKETRGPVPLL